MVPTLDAMCRLLRCHFADHGSVAGSRVREKIMGVVWGLVCGDALGMPADNSVNIRALDRDYGYIEDFSGP